MLPLERANNGGGVARVPRNNGNRAQLSRVSQGNPVIIRSFSTPKKHCVLSSATGLLLPVELPTIHGNVD